MIERFSVSAVYAALISLGPVLLIYHRSFDTFWQQQSWQNTVFFAIYILFGAMAMTKGFPDVSKDGAGSEALSLAGFIRAAKKHEFAIFISCSFFLYVACCALCRKLDFTQLSDQALFNEVWKTAGLLIILLAMVIQVGLLPLKRIVHPIYFSCLLLLVGLPLLFSAWMPLFAVPGAFIIFKWRIKMQNRSMGFVSDLSDNATAPSEKPSDKAIDNGEWQILPFVF